MFTAKDNLHGAITTLSLNSACISGHGAVSANNPMARYDDADGIRSVCRTNGTRRARTAQLLSQLAVMHYLPAGDSA